MREENQQKIALNISPSQYSQKHSKQLGNHFMYAKLNNNQKWNDARLKILKPHYFLARSILDIGCNEGILSIPIALKYQPKIIKALDIDPQMTKKVKTNIQTFVNKNNQYRLSKQVIDEVQTLPKYFKQKLSKIFGQTVLQLSKDYEIRPKNIDTSSLFPKNIEVVNENIFTFDDRNSKFDCILCMNVTKWIHLALGDQGIKQLFHKIDKLSDEGGIFILEVHPWSSYRKKKNMFASYKHNYRMILLKPQRFKDYLQKLGFQMIETISPSTENSLKHEILVFQKRSATKSKQYF